MKEIKLIVLNLERRRVHLIKKEGNKYVLYSKNGKKKLGTYDTKKDAEKKAAQKALKSIMGKKIKILTSDTLLVKKKK